MTSETDAERLARCEAESTEWRARHVRPGYIDMRGYEVSDHIFDIVRQKAAIEEMFRAETFGAVLCPSGTHGDFVDGEVVPGDLPCRECGAAL